LAFDQGSLICSAATAIYSPARRLHLLARTVRRIQRREANQKSIQAIRIRAMTAGSKMFWAMLWIIGLPLPLLVILWFLFGSR